MPYGTQHTSVSPHSTRLSHLFVQQNLFFLTDFLTFCLQASAASALLQVRETEACCYDLCHVRPRSAFISLLRRLVFQMRRVDVPEGVRHATGCSSWRQTVLQTFY